MAQMLAKVTISKSPLLQRQFRTTCQVKTLIKCLNIADCIRLGFVFALQFDSHESKCSWKRLLRRKHLKIGYFIWIHRSTVLGCGMLTEMFRMWRCFKALYVSQLMSCKRLFSFSLDFISSTMRHKESVLAMEANWPAKVGHHTTRSYSTGCADAVRQHSVRCEI